MQLIKLDVNARCDMYLCRNSAKYRVVTGGSGGVFPWQRGGSGLYLCPDCLQKLYEAIGKVLVPKSPDNMIKKAVKRREENEGE